MITHCGVFATTSNDIKDTIYGLQNLQHRGQESCGISFINSNNKIVTYKHSGFWKPLDSSKNWNQIRFLNFLRFLKISL